MNNQVHKILGMFDSLDVTKVYWKIFPTALKGQFQGLENMTLLHQKWLLIITCGSGMHPLNSLVR